VGCCTQTAFDFDKLRKQLDNVKVSWVVVHKQHLISINKENSWMMSLIMGLFLREWPFDINTISQNNVKLEILKELQVSLLL
jgi:hypothetical protein